MLFSSMSASPTEEPESPPSSSLTHTSPYSLLSESSCSSSSSSISTNSSELCCCVRGALGVLLQFLHLQLVLHLLPFLTQLHRRVLHALTLEQEHPLNSRPSYSLQLVCSLLTPNIHPSFLSTRVIFQPYWARAHVITGSLVQHVPILCNNGVMLSGCG